MDTLFNFSVTKFQIEGMLKFMFLSLEINMEHMPLLVSIVRCLASLCSVEDVVRFLDSTCGSRLFIALIRCVVRCAAASGDVAPASSKRSIQLEDATINLLSQ